APQRLPLRDDRGGMGLSRGALHGHALPRVRGHWLPDREVGGRPVRLPPGHRDDESDRRLGDPAYGGRTRAPADDGGDAALHVLWTERPPRFLRGGGCTTVDRALQSEAGE